MLYAVAIPLRSGLPYFSCVPCVSAVCSLGVVMCLVVWRPKDVFSKCANEYIVYLLTMIYFHRHIDQLSIYRISYQSPDRLARCRSFITICISYLSASCRAATPPPARPPFHTVSPPAKSTYTFERGLTLTLSRSSDSATRPAGAQPTPSHRISYFLAQATRAIVVAYQCVIQPVARQHTHTLYHISCHRKHMTAYSMICILGI